MKLKILEIARFGPKVPTTDEIEHMIQNGLTPPRIKKIQLTGKESWTEIGEKRLAICMEPCEHRIYEGFLNSRFEVYKCGKCGCALKAKVLLPNAECPMGYW